MGKTGTKVCLIKVPIHASTRVLTVAMQALLVALGPFADGAISEL
jgi:hypothetical protein